MNKTSKTIPKHKTKAWFTPVRDSYLPVTPEGWATYLPFVIYLIVVCVASLKATDNILASILLIVPNWVAATAVMTFLASSRSK